MTDNIEEVAIKKSKTPLIVVTIVAVNIAVIAVVITLFSKPSGETQKSANDSETGAVKEVGPLINLDSFIVNIEGEKGTRYLKAALTVEIKNETVREHFEKSIMLVRNEVLMYLSEMNEEKIKSMKQKRDMEVELKKLLNKRLKSNVVLGVYFTEFVTQ